MARLLVVGGVQSASGYGRVVREVGIALREVVDVAFVQVGPNDGIESPGQVWSTPYPHDFLSLHFVPELIKSWGPDITLIIHDLCYCATLITRIKRILPDARIITYCPFEGHLVDASIAIILLQSHISVFYCQHDLQLFRSLTRPPISQRLEVIPHGVDWSIFKSNLKSRESTRGALFGFRGAQGITFLALNANTNTRRKRLDATLRVFSTFAVNKPPGVKLLLTGLSRSADGGYDVIKLASKLGIGDRLLTSSELGLSLSLDDNKLSMLYNSADVGINTSEAEGWGLIAYEHAACGVAQILPAHAAAAERWAGYPGLIDISSPSQGHGTFALSEVNENSATDVLQSFYSDLAFREQSANKALNVATQPDLSWSFIGQRWRMLIASATLES
jgi:glycosyltransferase involved in cell wall biosynthesis